MSRTRHKILHVINWLSIGGSENLLVNHVTQLAGAYPEIENRVLVLGSRANANPDYLARLPVSPEFLEFSGRYRDPVASAYCIARLRRVIRAFRPDIVHSYLWLADVFTALAVRASGAMHVSHVLDRRGDRDATKALARWRTRLTGRLLRGSGARFAAVSDACRNHAMRHYLIAPGRIVTVHNGINPVAFSPSPQAVFSRTPVTFGMIGRFAEEKGHGFLIDALTMLPAARLEIAGWAPGVERLRARVAEKGLSERVAFLGEVSSVAALADFYRRIDALVVPSIAAEGLPTTILEAMASALPVIATEIGGAPEAIRHGLDGLLVPARDPGALASAMQSLLADPAAARAMGASGHARLQSLFTVDVMTRKIVSDVYAHPVPPPNRNRSRPIELAALSRAPNAAPRSGFRRLKHPA